eukprot:COSAG01_NODE_39582_length_474_cov_5.984000_1_plen_66_part_01
MLLPATSTTAVGSDQISHHNARYYRPYIRHADTDPVGPQAKFCLFSETPEIRVLRPSPPASAILRG